VNLRLLLAAESLRLCGQPAAPLLPKYFLNFQTKSAHMRPSIPMRFKIGSRLAGMSAFSTVPRCLPVHPEQCQNNPLGRATRSLYRFRGRRLCLLVGSALARSLIVSGESQASRRIDGPFRFFASAFFLRKFIRGRSSHDTASLRGFLLQPVQRQPMDCSHLVTPQIRS